MSDGITKEEIVEQFKENKTLKMVTIAAGVVVVGVIGFILYQNLVVKKNEEASVNSFETAEGINFMASDSTNMAIEALEGSVSDYDGYTGGEVAQYALATQLFKSGDFEGALDQLNGVELEDTYLSTLAEGMKGDCKSEMGDYQGAVAAYLQAANKQDNDVTSPMFLFKAGLNAEEAGDFGKATELYTKIKDNYSAYASQNNIDKYVMRASSKK